MSVNSLSSADAVWFLDGHVDESEPVRLVVNKFPFRVGRGSNLELCLRCRTVSKLHAEIVERDGELWITDLGSTNGTFINGTRLDDTKQIGIDDLVQFGKVVFRAGQELGDAGAFTICEDVYDHALALVQFDKLMTTRAVLPFFQPIVEIQKQQTVGYELLSRSRLFGLKDPHAMFLAAAQLNQEVELSQLLRHEGIRISETLNSLPNLFVNLHPAELVRPGLMESLSEIRDAKPDQPLTLEVHESIVTDSAKMRRFRDSLSDLDMMLAYDDFGAGQARLIELLEVPPDVVKFDIGLVRNISVAPASRQELVETLVRISIELGIAPLAEGVECAEDGETCRQLGFELAQGYYYGRPATAASYNHRP